MPYAQKSESSEHSIPRWLSRQGWLCLFGRALSLSPSLSLNVISRWQLISSHPRMTRTFQRYQNHPNGEADKCYVNYDLLLWWGWGQESHTILKTLLGWLDSALNKSFPLSPFKGLVKQGSEISTTCNFISQAENCSPPWSNTASA